MMSGEAVAGIGGTCARTSVHPVPTSSAAAATTIVRFISTSEARCSRKEGHIVPAGALATRASRTPIKSRKHRIRRVARKDVRWLGFVWGGELRSASDYGLQLQDKSLAVDREPPGRRHP